MVRNTKELKIINTVNRINTTVEKIPNLKLLILLGVAGTISQTLAFAPWLILSLGLSPNTLHDISTSLVRYVTTYTLPSLLQKK